MEMVDTKSRKDVQVVSHVAGRGFVVDNLWARGTQGGLAAVVFMVLVLCFLIGSRKCNLDGEPNSLAEALRLLAASPDVSANLENSEYCSPQQILQRFDSGGRRYILELVEGKGSKIRVDPALSHSSSPAITEKMERIPWKEELWALRNVFGIGCLVGFGFVLAILWVAFVFSRAEQGESVASKGRDSMYRF